MGKHKYATKGGTGTQKGASPTPSSHLGEAGDTDNTVKALMERGGIIQESTIADWCFFQNALCSLGCTHVMKGLSTEKWRTLS